MKISIALILLFLGCNLDNSTSQANLHFDEKPSVIVEKRTFSDFDIVVKPDSTKSYTKQLQNFKNLKSKCISLYKSSSNKNEALDSIGKLYTSTLVNAVFPYWYGTPWDFNGYTNVPKQGEIACGYFVSTTLKHSGMNLNRYRMAQQASLLEVKTIQLDNNHKKYANIEVDSLVEKLKTDLKEGIYIVGLDYHVGYILKQKGEIFFIHSDYFNDKVTIELAEKSQAFIQNEVYYFGEISTNRALIKKWLYSTELKVVTS